MINRIGISTSYSPQRKAQTKQYTTMQTRPQMQQQAKPAFGMAARLVSRTEEPLQFVRKALEKAKIQMEKIKEDPNTGIENFKLEFGLRELPEGDNLVEKVKRIIVAEDSFANNIKNEVDKAFGSDTIFSTESDVTELAKRAQKVDSFNKIVENAGELQGLLK